MDTNTLILALILLIQTIVIVVLAIYILKTTQRFHRSMDKVDSIVEKIQPKVDVMMGGVSDFVNACRPMGEQLVDISANLKDIVRNAREATDDVTEFVKDTSQAARYQVSQIDNVITDTVKKMASVTNTLTDNILTPITEIAAVLKGVRVTIGYLRGERNRKEVNQAVSDEEMFI